MKQNVLIGTGNKIVGGIKIIIVSLVITVILLALVAFGVHQMTIEDKIIDICVCIIYGVSCLVGGYLLAYMQKKRRLVCGVAFGMLYFIAILAVSLIVGGGKIDITSLIRCVIVCVVCGAVGGIMVK